MGVDAVQGGQPAAEGEGEPKADAMESINEPCISSVFEPEEGRIEEDFLRTCYETFLNVYGKPDNIKGGYSGLLGKYLKPKLRSEALVNEMKTHKTKALVSGFYSWASPTKPTLIPTLLAYIFALITTRKAVEVYEAAGTGGDGGDGGGSLESKFLVTPHAAQVIAILRILGMGNGREEEDKEL